MTPSLEVQSSYAPGTPFNPMNGAHNSYSLTALSMAAEYQALKGNMANGHEVHHSVPTPSTLPTVMPDATLDESQTVMPNNSFLHDNGPTLEESLDNLASFLDNEPLSSYHFATLMSAEQPMYVPWYEERADPLLTSYTKALFLARVTWLRSGYPTSGRSFNSTYTKSNADSCGRRLLIVTLWISVPLAAAGRLDRRRRRRTQATTGRHLTQ